MWNSEAPMKLLEQMPARLNMANLERLQQVIDIDKYCASCEQGCDLCGEYAPFCSLCDKSLKCPCAVAYVKMRQAEGEFIEIATEEPVEEDATPCEAPVEEPAKEESKEEKIRNGIRIAKAVRRK